MLRICLVVASALVSTCSARSQEGPAKAHDPEKQALAFEVQECVAGKLRVSTQFFALQAQLSAAIKRAEEAEEKLKSASKPQADN